jgi:p-cumate 2,3-dioxygenase alpha subunit
MMSVRLDRRGDAFRVPRSAYVDQAVFEHERDLVFDRSWLYLGHSSELVKSGDYVTRMVAGRQLIFCRDREGGFRAFLNSCPHRGATVCRERQGNTKSFQCLYHGWVFGTDGQNKDLPGRDSYPTGFVESGRANLSAVPRLSEYRGFYFVSFDQGIVDLDTYLGDARPFLDAVCDQSADGMVIVGGTQEYAIRANWKLLVENSYDGYHAINTHSTYLDYLRNTNGGLTNVRLDGRGYDLGGGHGAVEYQAPWGRPVAQWIPMWGEDGRAEIDRIRAELSARVGEARATRIADYNRNLGIFPNLVVNDIMAITVRTFYPTAPDQIQVNAWALAPREESSRARRYRLHNFLEFLGPGGFATPDDIEALEQCQRGFQNLREMPWSDISKGLGRDTPSYDDETHIRAFWTEWAARMTPLAEAAE